jgi:hypothetical protein
VEEGWGAWASCRTLTAQRGSGSLPRKGQPPKSTRQASEGWKQLRWLRQGLPDPQCGEAPRGQGGAAREKGGEARRPNMVDQWDQQKVR